MSQFVANVVNKGDLGMMVEKYYFQYESNSSPEPDFPEAGVELKTTGVERRKTGGYRAKERLVLSQIDYQTLAQEEWGSASLMAKCRLMLILFYLYEKEVPVENRRFVPAPILFEFPEEDLVQIRLDWLTIKAKVAESKAHELSESDTYYLSACRKGPGGESEKLRTQWNSPIGARARAFSLKPRYLNQIIDREGQEPSVLPKVATLGIEEATRMKFEPYLGKTISELSLMLDFEKKGKNHKGYYRELTLRMLGTNKRTLPELDRADIEIKTIRVNHKWQPAEPMSFPTFKYLDIVSQLWEDSSFFFKLERRFLFVVFREDSNGEMRLEKAAYWNMPFEDREEARRVWEDTKRRTGIDASDLPSASESQVAHVRPKARNSGDTLPTPQGTRLVKKCFWLNRGYIANIIRLL